MKFLKKFFSKNKSCKKCGKQFKNNSDNAQFGSVDVILNQVNNKPTFCNSCNAYYCLGCAFEASLEMTKNYNICPNCGNQVPDNFSF